MQIKVKEKPRIPICMVGKYGWGELKKEGNYGIVVANDAMYKALVKQAAEDRKRENNCVSRSRTMKEIVTLPDEIVHQIDKLDPSILRTKKSLLKFLRVAFPELITCKKL